MDHKLDDFHMILPSNASMNYFPQNTPSRYRTKLAHPISLNGVWECALAEATIPGRFFTIQENYNDSYEVKRKVLVQQKTLEYEINIPLYNESNDDFFIGLNLNIMKLTGTKPLVFLPIENDSFVKIILDTSYDLRISFKHAQQLLYALHQPLRKDVFLKAKTNEKHSMVLPYRKPLGNLENQFITLVSNVPVISKKYEIKFEALDSNESDIFSQINSLIQLLSGENFLKFTQRGNELIIQMAKNIEIVLNKANSPQFMNALGIKDTSYSILGMNIPGETNIEYTKLSDNYEGEIFTVYVYKEFIKEHFEQRTEHLKIPCGMYHTSKDFFSKFSDIQLEELPNNKVKLTVPKDTQVRFGEKLKDILGFIIDVFNEGIYFSEYNLELNAGITEIYVYCDIIMPTLIGDSLSPILKVIPIANEKTEQIVKHFAVPLYFKIKNQHFDSIEIEMRTSNGTPIKFITGKSSLVLSFRKKMF